MNGGRRRKKQKREGGRRVQVSPFDNFACRPPFFFFLFSLFPFTGHIHWPKRVVRRALSPTLRLPLASSLDRFLFSAFFNMPSSPPTPDLLYSQIALRGNYMQHKQRAVQQRQQDFDYVFPPLPPGIPNTPGVRRLPSLPPFPSFPPFSHHCCCSSSSSSSFSDPSHQEIFLAKPGVKGRTERLSNLLDEITAHYDSTLQNDRQLSNKDARTMHSESHPAFESTSVATFLDWCEGRSRRLSPVVASDVGLDMWLYTLRGKTPPTSDQERKLKTRLLHLAHASPLSLHRSIVERRLKTLLGTGFEWVETNAEW